jgi:hypothetical protein
MWLYLDHILIGKFSACGPISTTFLWLPSGAECKRAKPFPDPYLTSMQRFGAEPHECIIFEDSRSGIQSGVAAHARLIIGIQSSLSDHILRRHGAHATIRDFTQFNPSFLLQVCNQPTNTIYAGSFSTKRDAAVTADAYMCKLVRDDPSVLLTDIKLIYK